ncbi:hypothetical protein EDD18DRAFT_1348421 [Armillaria luteobubalina]|uniref:Uncharacterized protein n=1 Tax=Armillaria luteobubalina TaxID=153913 RepID=A0AA39QEK0_9AGAR|nr:hypothetical protein EDD18DRAFT_1348421 [Armillaria luteobubalina]
MAMYKAGPVPPWSPSPPLMPPIKPFAGHCNHSGSNSSGSYRTNGLGMAPGLKNVLKIPSLTSKHQLGLSDLLPPSPSVAGMPVWNFSLTPSHLNSLTTYTPDPFSAQNLAFRDTVPPTTLSLFILGLPHTSSPPPLDIQLGPGYSQSESVMISHIYSCSFLLSKA